MKSNWIMRMLVGVLVLLMPVAALATNGDNLIGVGPVTRSMGGTGIAHPQDAIGAVFSNPAAMCFGEFCPSNEAEFAGTLFMPTVKGQIATQGQVFNAKSEGRVYPIPAMGVSFAFPELPQWRFGIGAYGISGLGVNYKGTSLDQRGFFPVPPAFGGPFPLAGGVYSDLMIMKFAPTVAYQVNDWLSFGGALNVTYSTLDLQQGNGANYGIGGQLGVIVKPHDKISMGLTYITPQPIQYRNVYDFDGNGSWDNLTLESPQTLGLGIAYEPLYRKLLFEVDVKWLNWSNAKGYSDFGWHDQIVVGVGAQYRPIPKLALRAGYNYGNNPLTGQHFNGPALTKVQGYTIPQYYYQSFRLIGFPAITANHLTLGASYDVTDRFTILFGYVHLFRNRVSSDGTNIFGQSTNISSALYENAIDFGLTWRF
jgi:long-chain fatty acid transport protein